MPLYEVECEGVAREVYEVRAQSPAEAKAIWPYFGRPVVTECTSMEPVDVREVEE
jgi:hypothetical protein